MANSEGINSSTPYLYKSEVHGPAKYYVERIGLSGSQALREALVNGEYVKGALLNTNEFLWSPDIVTHRDLLFVYDKSIKPSEVVTARFQALPLEQPELQLDATDEEQLMKTAGFILPLARGDSKLILKIVNSFTDVFSYDVSKMREVFRGNTRNLLNV